MGTKFEGVDILDFLGQVVELHTQHYKEDFDVDKELIQKVALSGEPEERRLLWMSRPCGTYCLSEREVYLQESNENKVWMFYHEQTNDPILAYALTLDGLQDGKVTGTIYPLDYPSHVERVKSLSCPIDRVTVTFEDGVQFTLPYQSRRRQINLVICKVDLNGTDIIGLSKIHGQPFPWLISGCLPPGLNIFICGFLRSFALCKGRSCHRLSIT